MPRFYAATQDDGWDRLEGIEGWDSHTVEVCTALVNGQPEVIGLRLIPHRENSEAILTSTRLRRIPMSDVATVSAAHGLLSAGLEAEHRQRTISDFVRAASRVSRGSDPRASTTVEEVAGEYLQALARGRPPRAEVCEQLGISSRTADRYIAQARREGLLPVYRKGRTDNSPAAGNTETDQGGTS